MEAPRALPAAPPPSLCAADSPEPPYRAGGRCASALPALRRGALHRGRHAERPLALRHRLLCRDSDAVALGHGLRQRLDGHRDVPRPRPQAQALHTFAGALLLLLQRHARRLPHQPRDERHEPHRGHARLEPRGYALGAVLPHLRVHIDAAAQLEARHRGHTRGARRGAADGVFPKPHPALEPPRAQAQLPHHGRLQRGHHGRQDLQDPGHRGRERQGI